MFLNRIVNKLDEEPFGYIFIGFIGFPVFVLLLTFTIVNAWFPLWVWILGFILTFILAEWCYIDYVKQLRNKRNRIDLIGVKLGSILASFPVVLFIFSAIRGISKIKYYLWMLPEVNWLLILKVIGLIIVIGGSIIGYFAINLKIANKYNKIRR